MTNSDNNLVTLVTIKCREVSARLSKMRRNGWTGLTDTRWRTRATVWLGYMDPSGPTYYLADNACVYRTMGKRRLFLQLPPRLCDYASLVRPERLGTEELTWLLDRLASFDKQVTPTR